MSDLSKRLPLLGTWLISGLVITLLVGLFLELAGDVWLNEGFAWDAQIMLAINHYSTPFLNQIIWMITEMGSIGAVVVSLVMGSWLWRKKQKTDIFALLASFGGGVGINTLLKVLFARPRPNVFPPLTAEHSYSFPSGHTMAAVTVYGFIAFWFWQRGQRGWALFSASWVVLIAFSRIYLGVHYPSDVLAGLAVGCLWLMVVLASYLQIRR